MSFGESVTELVAASKLPLLRAAPTWSRTSLASIASITNGYPWKSSGFNAGSGHPVVRIRNVMSGDTDTLYDGQVFDGYWVREGDLLVGMDGDFNRNYWNGPNALLNQRVCKIEVDERFFLRDFLYQALPPYLKLINDHTSSVTVKHLSSKTLSEIPLPLPPLAEQKRIVAKLDALSTRAARARNDLTRIDTLVKRYKQAVLSKAFSDHEIHTELSAFIDNTFYGPRFSKSSYVPSGIPTIRTTDFKLSGDITLVDTPRVAVSEKDFAKWGLVDSDILVTRTGSIGKCAVYKDSYGPALPSAYLIRVRLDLQKLDAKFAFFALTSPKGQEHLGVRSTAVTQPNINANAIRTLPIPQIELVKQKEIVLCIESAFRKIDRLAAETKRALELTGKLDEAVLAKAFRGELVPQDPSDEPASVLLDRIKADRAAQPKAKRRRGKKA